MPARYRCKLHDECGEPHTPEPTGARRQPGRGRERERKGGREPASEGERERD